MEGRKNSRVYILGALVLAVLSLSVGFATFSAVINISSSAGVRVSGPAFGVVFSSSGESYQTNPVVPTKSSDDVATTNATIDNTTTPTLNNVTATFNRPGQTVTYNLYVYNQGNLKAYINSITFRGNKTCSAVNGDNTEYVDAACDAIKASVKIGDTTVTNTTKDIREPLAKKQFKLVTITLTYDSEGSYTDAAFDVVFPAISIYAADTTDDNEYGPSGKTYLTSFSSDSSANDYFKEEAYKENIKNVYFVNYVDTTNALTTYDLSEDKDGSITGWIVANTSDTSKYDLYIGSEKNIYTKNFSYAFRGMSGIEKIEFNNLNTSENTSLKYTFDNCKSLTTLDVSHFDTSNVTTMSSMFALCTGLTTLDVSNFDTSNVTKMNYMFGGCNSLTTLDVSSFDTSKVTEMSYVFYSCNSLTTLDVSNFDTSNVTTMDSMFKNCNSLTTLDVSSFDTSKETSMSYMFDSCNQLTTIYVSNKFTTSAVTTSFGMFSGCTSLVGGAGTTYDENHVDKTYARIDGGTSNPGYFTAKA